MDKRHIWIGTKKILPGVFLNQISSNSTNEKQFNFKIIDKYNFKEVFFHSEIQSKVIFELKKRNPNIKIFVSLLYENGFLYIIKKILLYKLTFSQLSLFISINAKFWHIYLFIFLTKLSLISELYFLIESKKINKKQISKLRKILSKTSFKIIFFQSGISENQLKECQNINRNALRLFGANRQNLWESKWEIFNENADPLFSIYPDYHILAVRKYGTIDLSIIIPSHNDFEILRETLTAWCNQDGFENYEIILIDDGNEKSLDYYKYIFETFKVSFKIIRIPRDKKRIAGDNLFRAGVCRNVGAILSDADKLMFCDADILVSNDFLKKNFLKIKDKTLLQPIRRQIDLQSNILAIDTNNYWDNFYFVEGGSWENLPHRWRYVSTYCLGLKKSDFFDLGLFRSNYVYYGCEDTDLGWRAHQKNFVFKLSDSEVYHRAPDKCRSEYGNNLALKKKILKRAYIQLFKNTLCPYVYRELVFANVIKDSIDS